MCSSEIELKASTSLLIVPLKITLSSAHNHASMVPAHAWMNEWLVQNCTLEKLKLKRRVHSCNESVPMASWLLVCNVAHKGSWRAFRVNKGDLKIVQNVSCGCLKVKLSSRCCTMTTVNADVLLRLPVSLKCQWTYSIGTTHKYKSALSTT